MQTLVLDQSLTVSKKNRNKALKALVGCGFFDSRSEDPKNLVKALESLGFNARSASDKSVLLSVEKEVEELEDVLNALAEFLTEDSHIKFIDEVGTAWSYKFNGTDSPDLEEGTWDVQWQDGNLNKAKELVANWIDNLQEDSQLKVELQRSEEDVESLVSEIEAALNELE